MSDATNQNQPIELDRARLTALLAELGQELAAAGIRGEIFVVGGAAMALAYSDRRLTVDVDGVFEPKVAIYDAARTVAQRHRLQHDWLNDGVKGLLPGPDADPREILDLPGLSVSVPSPQYLLALKVAASRIDRDADDIAQLAEACGVTTAAEILDIAVGVVGSARLPPKAQFMVQEMFPDRPVDGGGDPCG